MKKVTLTYSIAISFFTVLLLVLCIILYKDNAYLENEIARRDDLLTSALNQDSIWQNKQDSIIQFVEKSIFFYVGNEKIAGDEFVKYVNSLYDKNLILQDSLDYYKQYYKMTQSTFKPHFSAKLDSASQKIMYTLKYTELDTALLNTQHIKDCFRDSERLKMLLKHYPIKIKEVKDGYIFESPKIDSALILLPYFRNRLEYIPEKKCWVIEH